MYYTIKTLLAKGKSQRAISRELGIHRKTVREMVKRIEKEGPYLALFLAKCSV